MSPPLRPSDFDSADTVEIAKRLLGQCLVLKGQEGTLTRVMIMETEAYHGPDDRASHAHKVRTPRNAPMFGPAGHWYVYLCYGVHEMLNLVTGPEGFPAAVLIRGVTGADGPGKLTRLLGIDRRFNGLRATPEVGLWLEPEPRPVADKWILSLPRVGVDYAGAEWAKKPWRFLLAPGPMRDEVSRRGGKALRRAPSSLPEAGRGQ